MSCLLAASSSLHLLPWLAACSLSGEALATMPCATGPPCQAPGPPGQHRLFLCCRRSLLMLMLKYWLHVPPQTSLHLPNIYVPKVQNGSTGKTWTTKSKVQFITQCFDLEKRAGSWKRTDSHPAAGQTAGMVWCAQEISRDFQAIGTSYR